MSLILGFGSTETAFEAAEENAFNRAVLEMFRESGEAHFFTPEVIEKVGKWLDKRAREYRAKDVEYKTATDFPERYSYYYPHVLGDASHIVAVVSFSHINRRHPMSPDGWALLSTKRCFCVGWTDLDVLEEAA